MKKIFAFLLCIVMMLSGTACTPTQDVDYSPPPANRIYLDFLSYEEWLDYPTGVDRNDRETYETWNGGQVKELQKLYKMKENYAPVIPYIADQPMELSSARTPITWKHSEGFALPWTLFFGKGVIVKISYLEDEWIISNKMSGLAIIRKLNRERKWRWPTPYSYGKDKAYYDKIYEEKIQLQDRSVKALVYDHKEDSWFDMDYIFVYDNLLVKITESSPCLTKEWFAQFSLREVELDAATGEIKAK